ncbi:hypothetical protein SGHV143 [Glossina pallidipes salivary gland hypertrophy virus]|uniref:Uncharacterized protein n=1 Tax=Glossina hytrovirus (isolate Glossina pallidipes/Ethiopia/Seibersdorf/-) TaxID=379529 RepID=B0YLU7_GHVS|nr:hypothetical protein SGHV143 [Glossina pallidipes salivary gland hypertrophy virus]ABQ08916.1 hypothetical protein SGHV143 [Glossina pallidipes salivary gland hypertrophy virus]
MESRIKYKNFLRHSKLQVKCTYCKQMILIEKYNMHIIQNHIKKTLGLCIWCLKYTWKQRAIEPEVHYGHRYACMMDRIKADNPQQIMMRKMKKNTSHLFLQCKECDKFINTSIKKYIAKKEIINISKYLGTPIDVNWKLIYSLLIDTEEGEEIFNSTMKFIKAIGFDSRWLRLFSILNVIWYHCSINYTEWDDIYLFLNNNANICVLPNWCISNLDNRRIILLVIPNYKNIFEKKIKGKCVIITTIKHFINSIRYLSCSTDSHYYVNSPVIPHFKLICIGLFKNSTQVLTSILTKPIRNMHLKANLTTNVINLKYLLNNHILPYEYVIVRSSFKTPLFLYNSNNEKIFFNTFAENFTNLDCQTYNQFQDDILNLFGNDEIKLNKHQIVMLHEINRIYQQYRLKLMNLKLQIKKQQQPYIFFVSIFSCEKV